MKTLGFVTCRDYPDFQKDEQLLLPALEALGIQAKPVLWENAASGLTDLQDIDLLVFRSCWNYHYHTAAFEAWLNQLEARSIRVLNPVSLVRWNLDKRYLRELEQAGVAIVPTVFTEAGDHDWIEKALAQDWPELVIKPIVSAWGANTFRVKRHELPEYLEKMAPQAQTTGLMLQPFVSEIAQGEISLVFYRSPQAISFSHAFVKTPAEGAFLSHEEFGARWGRFEATPAMRAAAEKALQAMPGEWLYARVDGVRGAGEFQLMELEVFEPSLYLAVDPDAPERFARVLNTYLV
ncbi:hypothetical protein COW36_11840 [bacterium (Candidatus Blackallbacteria) CG17_big_fil_post_rev_8_21_14_2_50_48_46]|uniref:ATP-grasp domain-containing protein n=1 Tax=bacterium (Candidatus Blackallbacteria) CG17_big_fil_post_rev_8_21_14_2_50_48_46 TaxID=2014261 RepID=A0A2M7G3L7_9BACT|nr:MAG: hypothetical protein COW64_03420 [bacterium (Candidatus Blackallbacteria) CG18_big_fil_WC_8_21_14_2_50_49_26]PIW16455.1 MAG: hypothetical protein COW36_11840 [bacterium (Candidatus Blackallbacteria) CG17_big_fil_post_rev_8_21_14_2_50_48_46]PIW45963.1 MAG: hypothetical protein COW20_17105 [bacterium (Candidatus Blackallbacteria) CG13_big_fil_rev_8_21_14_2_50_49_14]